MSWIATAKLLTEELSTDELVGTSGKERPYHLGEH